MSDSANDPNVVYFTRLHWVIFFGPLFGLGVSFALGYYVPPLKQMSAFLQLFALLWIGMTWATYYFSSLTIQKNQVILRTGILVRQTVDIPLNKIETIDIRQSIVGSIFNYGTLIITGTGGTRQFINYLHRPLTCRRYIEQLMNSPQ